MVMVEAIELADSDPGWYVIEERLEDGRVILRPENEVEAIHRENGSRPATKAEIAALVAEHGPHMLPLTTKARPDADTTTVAHPPGEG